MKIQIDENLYLSIEDQSFGLLSDKLGQLNSLKKFKSDRAKQFGQLTPREIEILTLLAEGRNNPEVAYDLDISRRTVENHRKSINGKLQISHPRDIIKYALAFGLIPFKQK